MRAPPPLAPGIGGCAVKTRIFSAGMRAWWDGRTRRDQRLPTDAPHQETLSQTELRNRHPQFSNVVAGSDFDGTERRAEPNSEPMWLKRRQTYANLQKERLWTVVPLGVNQGIVLEYFDAHFLAAGKLDSWNGATELQKFLVSARIQHNRAFSSCPAINAVGVSFHWEPTFSQLLLKTTLGKIDRRHTHPAANIARAVKDLLGAPSRNQMTVKPLSQSLGVFSQRSKKSPNFRFELTFTSSVVKSRRQAPRMEEQP